MSQGGVSQSQARSTYCLPVIHLPAMCLTLVWVLMVPLVSALSPSLRISAPLDRRFLRSRVTREPCAGPALPSPPACVVFRPLPTSTTCPARNPVVYLPISRGGPTKRKPLSRNGLDICGLVIAVVRFEPHDPAPTQGFSQVYRCPVGKTSLHAIEKRCKRFRAICAKTSDRRLLRELVPPPLCTLRRDHPSRSAGRTGAHIVPFPMNYTILSTTRTERPSGYGVVVDDSFYF